MPEESTDNKKKEIETITPSEGGEENQYLKLYEEEKKKSVEQAEQLKKKNEQITNLTKANKAIRQRSRSEATATVEESDDDTTTDDDGDEVIRAPSGKLYKKRHIDDIMDMVKPTIEASVKPVLDKASRFEVLDEIKSQADSPEQQQLVEHLYWNKFKPSGNIKDDVADVLAYVRGKTGGAEPNPINRRMGFGGSSAGAPNRKGAITQGDLEVASMFNLTEEDLKKSSGGVKRL